jgi:hypothetical protein
MLHSDAAELETAIRVLQAATRRLNDHMAEAKRSDDSGGIRSADR